MINRKYFFSCWMFLFLCDINLELSHLRKKRNFIRTLGFGSFANFLITYFFWILESVNYPSIYQRLLQRNITKNKVTRSIISWIIKKHIQLAFFSNSRLKIRHTYIDSMFLLNANHLSIACSSRVVEINQNLQLKE